MARPSTIDNHPQSAEIMQKLRENTIKIAKLAEQYGVSRDALYRQKAKLPEYDKHVTAKNVSIPENYKRDTFGENISEDLEMIRADLIAIKNRTMEDKPDTAIKAMDKLLQYVKTVIEIYAERREQEKAKREQAYEQLRDVVKRIVSDHPEIGKEIQKELEHIE